MLTEETKDQCRLETIDHIGEVRSFLNIAVSDLMDRSVSHDASKLEEPEFSIFCEFTPLLKSSKYGSKDYHANLEKMKIAIDHHYSLNRHHPDHFQDGVEGMTLIDLLEMICDWMAAVKRHGTGDIHKSIEINKERYSISEELVKILTNTVLYLENKKEFEESLADF